MHINATEQTSTFPCPESKLKGRLMDNMGKTWQTTHGTFEINMDTIINYFQSLPHMKQIFIIISMNSIGFVLIIISIKRWLTNR